MNFEKFRSQIDVLEKKSDIRKESASQSATRKIEKKEMDQSERRMEKPNTMPPSKTSIFNSRISDEDVEGLGLRNRYLKNDIVSIIHDQNTRKYTKYLFIYLFIIYNLIFFFFYFQF